MSHQEHSHDQLKPISTKTLHLPDDYPTLLDTNKLNGQLVRIGNPPTDSSPLYVVDLGFARYVSPSLASSLFVANPKVDYYGPDQIPIGPPLPDNTVIIISDGPWYLLEGTTIRVIGPGVNTIYQLGMSPISVDSRIFRHFPPGTPLAKPT